MSRTQKSVSAVKRPYQMSVNFQPSGKCSVTFRKEEIERLEKSGGAAAIEDFQKLVETFTGLSYGSYDEFMKLISDNYNQRGLCVLRSVDWLQKSIVKNKPFSINPVSIDLLYLDRMFQKYKVDQHGRDSSARYVNLISTPYKRKSEKIKYFSYVDSSSKECTELIVDNERFIKYENSGLKGSIKESDFATGLILFAFDYKTGFTIRFDMSANFRSYFLERYKNESDLFGEEGKENFIVFKTGFPGIKNTEGKFVMNPFTDEIQPADRSTFFWIDILPISQAIEGTDKTKAEILELADKADTLLQSQISSVNESE